MHVPDGFLSPQVWIPTAAVAAAGVAYAARRARLALEDRMVPLMGVMGAFVFAAQMINFPVLPGASGHLVGALLLTLLLGPHAAVMAMTTVLIIQCLLFQDGGLTALGLNVCTMALIPCYLSRSLLDALTRAIRHHTPALVITALVCTALPASLAALALGLSGVAPLTPLLALMTAIHLLIGLGEGLITLAILRFLRAVRPDLAIINNSPQVLP